MTAPSNANTSGLETAGHVVWWKAGGVNYYPEGEAFTVSESYRVEPLVTAASAQARIAKLEADAVRSEKHRNDLADKITSQSIELGALRSRINALNADTPHHLVLHDGTDAWCSAAAWKWFQAWSVRADEEASRATAAEARADRLAASLIAALPYVESCEYDNGYKPGAVLRVVKNIRAALQQETQP